MESLLPVVYDRLPDGSRWSVELRNGLDELKVGFSGRWLAGKGDSYTLIGYRLG